MIKLMVMDVFFPTIFNKFFSIGTQFFDKLNLPNRVQHGHWSVPSISLVRPFQMS
jgi:hypothetical protein